MKKKNWLLVVIILIAALLIAIVFWVYAKRIEHIENKIKIQSISIRATSGGKTFTTLSMIPPTCQSMLTFFCPVSVRLLSASEFGSACGV